MNPNSEDIRERCQTNADIKARKEVCVTRIGGVDDGVLEGSEKQRDHDEEEEFGDWKTVLEHDPRQTE